MILVLVFFILSYFVWRLKPDGISYGYYLSGWCVKVLFGVLFMLIHTYIYGVGEVTVDWEEYMNDSVVLRDVAFQSLGDYLKLLFSDSHAEALKYLSDTNHWSAGDMALINDSRNVLRVNSLVAFISNGNVYVHILFFAFISFVGLVELFRAFKNRIGYSQTFFWIVLLLFPSLGFWTSSVLKEPLMITGFAFVLHSLLGELTWQARVWRMVLGLLLMLSFKPYVLGCFLLALPVWGLARFVFKRRKILAVVSYFGGMLLLFWCLPPLKNRVTHQFTRMQFDFMNVGRGGVHVLADSVYYYFRTDQMNQLVFDDSNYVKLKQDLVAKKVTPGMRYPFDDVKLTRVDGPWLVVFVGTKCGSYIELVPIDNRFGNLILSAPQAVLNAAFRPTFFDPGGRLKLINFAETVVLFGFLAFSMWKFRKMRTDDEKALLIFLGCFALLLFVVIGWTTPVLGALVRYRLPAYLALFLMAFIGTKYIKLENE